MDAVVETWPGEVRRVDLLQSCALGPNVARRVRQIGAFSHACSRAALRFRPDVILCGLIGLLPVAISAAALRRQRTVLLLHGVEAWDDISPYQQFMVRQCGKHLAISRYTARHFAARAGLDSQQVDVVLLPISSLLTRMALEAPANAPSAIPVLLTVSRIAADNRYKGHFTIARSLPDVLHAHPAARWIVVGTGDDVPALLAECRRLGVESAVTMTGHVTDHELGHLYRRADVFVLPSVADADSRPPVGEGFGLVYAEAGAFGVPSIASSAGGGAGEFVVDGETGLTVPPDDAGELAGAISQLLHDNELRMKLGGRARAKVLTHHLPSHFGHQLTHLLSAQVRGAPAATRRHGKLAARRSSSSLPRR